MWEYTHYDELCHYGVKGMRWGVRRTPAQLGHKVTKIKKKTSKVSTEAKSKTKTLTTEEKKSQVLASRSAKELYENRKLFSYEELNRAYNLLDLDRRVAGLIVKEPSKVEKFVDDKVIPWANRVKNIAEPVVATMKKIDEASKLFGGDDNDASSNNTKKTNKSDKKKDSKTEKEKESESKDDKKSKSEKDTRTDSKSKTDYDDYLKDRGTITKERADMWERTDSKSKTIWDVDYVDITPSRETKSLVSNLGNTSVKALPSSSQASTFIAGLLDEPKE